MCYIQYCYFSSGGKKKSVGEVVVDRTNYRGCQFDEHLIQCETSTDISRIMNESAYVQNYF